MFLFTYLLRYDIVVILWKQLEYTEFLILLCPASTSLSYTKLTGKTTKFQYQIKGFLLWENQFLVLYPNLQSD